MNTRTPIRAIRFKCLDCQGSSKMVAYCTCDGTNSTRCQLWPYRFGRRPTSVASKFGKMFITPRDMPDPNTCIDDLYWPPRVSGAPEDAT